MFEVADVIEYKKNKYLIMDLGFYENKKYLFLNKLDENEEPTVDNTVLEVVEDEAFEVPTEILNVVLSKFVNHNFTEMSLKLLSCLCV